MAVCPLLSRRYERKHAARSQRERECHAVRLQPAAMPGAALVHTVPFDRRHLLEHGYLFGQMQTNADGPGRLRARTEAAKERSTKI